MTPYPSWCACREAVGETDGAILVLAGRWEIRRPVTLWCPHCGAATHWHPKRPRIDTTPAPVYDRRVEV